MTTKTFRKLAYAALALPLALSLAACDSTPDGEAAKGKPIAPIEAPTGQQWTDMVTISDLDGYVLGNPDAPIKLVEYASLTCPHCATFAADAEEPLKSDYIASGRVSYELRNQIHGPHDLALATLVRCGTKESFHPLSEQVWANLQAVLQPVFDNAPAVEKSLALPEDQRLVQLAQIGGFYDFFAARGISSDQARACLADPEKYKKIAENSTTQSQELGIEGTPSFFINGRKLDAGSWGQVEPALQRAGAR